MARPVQRGLRRTVGVGGLFATAYGNVGSSIYYALGLVAAHALGLTPVVFMLAGGLFALTAKSYAECAAIYPEAGGASAFARYAFGSVASFVAGWALCLDYVLTVAISAFSVAHYLGPFVPALSHGPYDVLGGLAVIAALAALNVRGLRESAGLNIALAVLDLATQLLLVIVGLSLVFDPARLVDQVQLGVAPTWGELVFALSIAMLAFTGIETVSNMAEEARNPERDVGRAVNLVLLAVLGIYAGMSTLGVLALPVERTANGGYETLLGTRYRDDPLLGVVQALPLPDFIQNGGAYYVGGLAAVILVIATNAGLIGISRLTWSLAEHRQLPNVFSRVHRRYGTPWVTIVSFSVVAALLVLPGRVDLLGNLYAFGALISFTVAHVSLIAIRIQRPELGRPVKAPWNVRLGGRELSLGAVIGGLGTFAAWLSVVVLHPEARLIGIPWLLVGTVGYVVYRRRIGVPASAVVRLERPAPPPEFKDVAYQTILIPILGEDLSADALVKASRLARDEARVVAIYVLRVPSQYPLDAHLPELEAKAEELLDAVRVRGRQLGLRVETALVKTRDPGRAIIEEARRRRSQVIYLDTTHAPPGEGPLGPTGQRLLRERPCRVLIEWDPRKRREVNSRAAGGAVGRVA